MIFASIRQRISAFLLDYLLIALYIILLVMISVGLGRGPFRSAFRTMFANPNSSEISAFLLLVLPVILYFTLFESSPWQASLGKRKLGLYVIDTHGQRLTLPISFVRSIVKFLPWELTHACLWRIPGWPLNPTTPSPILLAGLVLVWILVDHGWYQDDVIYISDKLPGIRANVLPEIEFKYSGLGAQWANLSSRAAAASSYNARMSIEGVTSSAVACWQKKDTPNRCPDYYSADDAYLTLYTDLAQSTVTTETTAELLYLTDMCWLEDQVQNFCIIP